MESTRTLIAFGRFSREDQNRLAVAATEAGLDLDLIEDVDAAREALTRGMPTALLVESACPSAEALVLDARGDVERAAMPIFMMASEIGDLEFAAAFAMSADDAIQLGDARPLVRRLRALRQGRSSAPSSGRGRALLAEPDRRRRSVVGRTLRNAGYAVTFAVTADDALEYSTYSDFALVIVSTELVPDQIAAIEAARNMGSQAAWIASSPPRTLKAMRSALRGMPRVMAIDAFTSPDAVLFVSNDLLHARGADNRASPRVLYGATVAFRGAGRSEDEHGYTYNISEGGLYVRTVALPEDDMVWVELTPPRSERRVRLVGKVAWRRTFGAQAQATVPVGFGVQIIDAARSDFDAWRAGYAAFVDAMG